MVESKGKPKLGDLLEVTPLGSDPSLSDLRDRQSHPAFSVEGRSGASESGALPGE